MYKSKLQEVCHQYGWNLPEYATEKDGPDHTPRFTATVTVNGLTFDSPTEHLCRSSKDAQNLAAQTAFLHFTAPKSISPSSGASTSNSKVDVRPPNRDIVQQRQNNIGQLSRVSEVPSARREPDSSKGVLHLYKNRLQHYAQKQNLALPAYSFETDGPAHARRFRSKVTVDGKTYETQEFFSTLKEAEHAAAKVASESLALNDIQEDEGLYKSLLQELAQKKGLLFPYYDTAKIGAPHMPIFRSTVLVGTGIFQGQEAKTKKQAETYAAKVAYNALMKGGQLDEPHKVLPTSLGYASSDFTPVVQQKPKSTIQEVNLQKEEGDTNTSSVINDPSPAASCSPDNQSSTSVVLHHSTMESTDSGKFGGPSFLAKEKIFIFPRNASVELPKGASVMPYNDEKWVAASLDMNPNQ